MAFTSIQVAFGAGEISPSLFGRVDLAKWHQGASTMRNFFANYRGGASSRAGLAYVGMCKQAAPNAGGTPTSNPPRDITFQFSINQGYALEFGDQYMRIKSNGAYVTEASKTITAITRANPGVFTSNSHGFSNGDWVFLNSIGGMTSLNGLTYIVQNVTTNTFTLTDLFGNAVNTAMLPVYTSGGTASRIYTVVAPYAAIDLPYLKYTQSADTMSLTCVNLVTHTEYAPYDLVRNGATNWVFTAVSFASDISPPTNVVATAHSSTTLSTYYSYVVTAIDAASGQESVASTAAQVQNNDIAINAGSNSLTWDAVATASSYNVYSATPQYGAAIPAGVLYGFLGTSLGANFVDTNIVTDFTKVPPTHQDPFARGALATITPTAGGASYTQATVGYTITTATGSGAILQPIVSSGAVVSWIVVNGGKGYLPGDTVAVTDSGSGTGATATLNVGPETGTYPGTVAYYQQRRVYGSTLNNPDTYWMSQPGAFLNMDSSIPTSDGDAIVGTPWAQQVNGVQFMVPMPGGLVVLTGKGAWQLTGGNSAAITPSDQTASPQAYNGCNDIVAPIVVNYDILYLQAKGSIFRDLSYNFFVNIYTGTDLTVLSNHLFSDHTFSQWSWAEEPYKLAWAIRDDGVALSLTYLKEQDVYAWARHDTNGLFVGVTVVTEPPVDAPYFIIQRYIQGKWVYYSERMNNRTWDTVEDCWCVDAALQYTMNSPNATLTATAAFGTQNITSGNIINGGTGYSAPTIEAVDPTGKGTGFTGTLTIVSGVITALNVLTSGSNYQAGTTFIITDSTGRNGSIQPIITNQVMFTASSGIFTSANEGDVIRMGGGIATVTNFLSATQVFANLTQNITATLPNDPDQTPVPQIAGNWTITTPTSVVSGLNHLEGKTVAILADGSVVPNQIVSNGAVQLPQAYSAIIVGLPYTAQLQTLYLDPSGQPTTSQSKRKNIYSVAVRAESSRGMQVGTNQPDQSTQPNDATVPWTNMKELKERNAQVKAGQAIPLFTGDSFINIPANWDTKGQIAVQQTYPLPANILAVIAYYQIGDTSG